MTVIMFDLANDENNIKAFDTNNLVLGKPLLYDDKGLLYPLKYRSDGEVCDILFMFPKTRASYGLNTKAHLVDLTLGSKDNYKENPLWEFLSTFDTKMTELLQSKIPDVEYDPMVQFSKKKDAEGNLQDNLEYGPHYTIGLVKRSNRYIMNVHGEKARSFDIFDVEGMLSPGVQVQIAATIGGVYVNEQKVGRIRPKLHTLRNSWFDIDVHLEDHLVTFQEL